MLNVKKELDKKIEATDGDRSCNIEFKEGTSTLVITCYVGNPLLMNITINLKTEHTGHIPKQESQICQTLINNQAL